MVSYTKLHELVAKMRQRLLPQDFFSDAVIDVVADADGVWHQPSHRLAAGLSGLPEVAALGEMLGGELCDQCWSGRRFDAWCVDGTCRHPAALRSVTLLRLAYAVYGAEPAIAKADLLHGRLEDLADLLGYVRHLDGELRRRLDDPWVAALYRQFCDLTVRLQELTRPASLRRDDLLRWARSKVAPPWASDGQWAADDSPTLLAMPAPVEDDDMVWWVAEVFGLDVPAAPGAAVLLVPRFAADLLVAHTSRPGEYATTCAAPEDPAVATAAAALWDPHGPGPLASLRGAVDAAAAAATFGVHGLERCAAARLVCSGAHAGARLAPGEAQPAAPVFQAAASA